MKSIALDVAEDRLWLGWIPADQLALLLTNPHNYISEIFDKTLTNAFSLIYRDRVATAGKYISQTGIQVPADHYVVSGIDGTGLLMIEGPHLDEPTNDRVLPRGSKGFESTLTEFDTGGYFGALHSDTGGAFAAARIIMLAIRHRSKLAELLSATSWKREFQGPDGNRVALAAGSYNVTFSHDLTIFYHGTQSELMQSCLGSTFFTEDDPRVATNLDIEVRAIGTKSPNPVKPKP